MRPTSVRQPRVDKRHPHRQNLQFDILPDGDFRHDYRRFAAWCCRPSNQGRDQGRRRTRRRVAAGRPGDHSGDWPVRFRRTGRARPNCRLARTSWRKMIADRSDGSGYPDAPMQRESSNGPRTICDVSAPAELALRHPDRRPAYLQRIVDVAAANALGVTGTASPAAPASAVAAARNAAACGPCRRPRRAGTRRVDRRPPAGRRHRGPPVRIPRPVGRRHHGRPMPPTPGPSGDVRW